LTSFAFPGAEHTRFAHAVGAAHVMQLFLSRLRQIDHDLPFWQRVTSERARDAIAAALLHDVGHGPLSHLFEEALPGALHHEAWTERILLDPSSEVHRILIADDPYLPQRVVDLIRGRHPLPYLAKAVSGTFDVDRCDYLVRDSYMTGVRYGLLDVDWLLASLRLAVPRDGTSARLAVDGEKGLTAVEGFFLARLYMYRQVYLHKAVRAAEHMIHGLFRRLLELDRQPATPPVLEDILRGRELSVGAYLELDDTTLITAIAGYAGGPDPVLARLAAGLRDRVLFKTLRLAPSADSAAAEAKLAAVLAEARVIPSYLGAIDRVHIDAYTEDDALAVLRSGGRVQQLLDASPVLRGLSRERFVHHRAVFPPELRARVADALGEFT
jgi:HD superfamily phosphohydrolase